MRYDGRDDRDGTGPYRVKGRRHRLWNGAAAATVAAAALLGALAAPAAEATTACTAGTDPVSETLAASAAYPARENPYADTVASWSYQEPSTLTAAKEAADAALSSAASTRAADAGAAGCEPELSALDAAVSALDKARGKATRAGQLGPLTDAVSEAESALHAKAEAQRAAEAEEAARAAAARARAAAGSGSSGAGARSVPGPGPTSSGPSSAGPGPSSGSGSSGAPSSGHAPSSSGPGPSGSSSSSSGPSSPSGSAWVLSYSTWDGQNQARWQSMIDGGSLVRLADWNYFAAHNWSGAGQRIRSCPSAVVCDGRTYRYVRSWTQSYATVNSVCDQCDSYNGGSGLVFQTCSGSGGVFLAYYRA